MGLTPAINEFWSRTLERLGAEPIEAAIERLAEPLPYEKYRVTMRSLDGVRVLGYLAKPIRGERAGHPLPALVTGPGYGGTEQGVTLAECQRGYIVLQLFPRGKGPSAELWDFPGDQLGSHLESPEGHYYQGGYCDMVRGIDYLASRDDVDSNRIGAVGTSQGGGLVLAAGALDSRVRAVVAHVPFLCDYRGCLEIHDSLVYDLLVPGGLTKESDLATLDYFDALTLAPRINAPTLLSTGGRDIRCPTRSIERVFDALAGIKSIVHYPELTHTSCGDFYDMSWEWLDRYVKRI